MLKTNQIARRPQVAVSVTRTRFVPLAGFVALATVAVLMLSLSSPRAAGVFDPTITFETSTTRATAHPDLRITVDNSGSDEDIKDLSIDMPNGFWGSLDAVPFKCSFVDAQAGACDPETKVGTIRTEALIDDSAAELDGGIYLTEPAPGNDDPAGLSIEVPAQVGGVDLGSVIVNARVMARYDNTVTIPVGGVGPIKGIRTVISDIPDSHTDNSANNSGRVVTFKMTRMVADLKSDQSALQSPLLTNPSRCGTTAFSWTATGDDVGSKSDSSSYIVDQCETVKMGVSQFSFTPSTTAAGVPFDLTTELAFDPNGPGVATAQVILPPFASPDTPALGNIDLDQCPVETFQAGPVYSVFNPATCPVQAKVGSAEAITPMLPTPLIGDVYLIRKAPVPNIGIYFGPSVDASNPKGVTISLVGTTATVTFDPFCDPLVETCDQTIRMIFAGIPDAPVTALRLQVGGPPRTDYKGEPLSGQILKMSAPADPICVGSGDVAGRFLSHSDPPGPGVVEAQGVDEMLVTGCSSPSTVGFTSGPVGATTPNPLPSFGFTAAGATNCSFDFADAEPCTSPLTPASGLSNGIHHVTVTDLTSLTRGFVVKQTPAADSPPTTTIDTGPAATTSDTTPSWTFTANESSKFQCSIDDGAFMPCDPAAPLATSGNFTVPAADEFLPGSSHTFAVRSQDVAGNVDSLPAEVSFDVSVPFSPTFDVSLTTNVARAHPEADITITNPSEQDLEDTTIRMPDGFFGGLQGVAEVCPVAVSDAGGCGADSQVGTIKTEAVVDESIVRISGAVYMTEARQPGDAAGLSIKVPAVIQSINMGDIIVPARLSVRGDAQGIDSLVVGVPRSIDPPDAINPWDGVTNFTMRKLELKLRNNPAAAQPLLTNPSSCAAAEFKAEFKTYTSTTASVSDPFTVTGCEALGFSPRLSATITRTDGKPVNAGDFQDISLTANLVASPDEAGIKHASILMPKPLTINVAKLPLVICEQAQFEALACPASAIIGSATATSPLLLPGETLSGPVYILRGSGTVLPRLFVRLTGRISVSVVGATSFENSTQIRTVFNGLPDAPLSSFSLTVSNLLSTMKKPCELGEKYGRAMTGVLTGHNGAPAAVNSEFVFDCAGIAVAHRFKKKSKKTTLSLTLRTQGSQLPMRKVKLKLAKYLTMNKRALKRKLRVRADGKKIAGKCIRFRNKSVLELNLCGKRYKRIDIAFLSGSLTAHRKLRRPAVKVTVTPGPETRSKTFTVSLRKNQLALALP